MFLTPGMRLNALFEGIEIKTKLYYVINVIIIKTFYLPSWNFFAIKTTFKQHFIFPVV